MKRMALVALICLGVGACSDTGGYKQPIGGLIGAGTGAFIGSQIGGGTGRLAATAVGALLGAAVGSSAGASLDRADQLYYHPGYAVPQQVPPAYYRPPAAYYSQPMVSHYPAPTYGHWAGRNCQPLVSPGAAQSGLACQAPNGGWFIAP
jgi:Glycine zipper 2TM domain